MFNIITDLELSNAEIDMINEEAEKALMNKSHKVGIESIVVTEEGGELKLKINYNNYIKRTRRITGYLSEADRFNDAKIAELRDRVPHALTI